MSGAAAVVGILVVPGCPVRLRTGRSAFTFGATAAGTADRGGAADAVGAAGEADLRDIRASLSGDGEAYARLVRRHQDSIADMMWRFARDEAACEELVQDVFVEAYVGLRGYRAEAPFEHWLRRIAVRVGYRHLKRSTRERSLARRAKAEPAQAAPESDAEGPAAALHGLLAQLPPPDRLVLTLMYLQGCSVAEVASLTGWSGTLVKVRAFRARRRLRDLWEKRERERGK